MTRTALWGVYAIEMRTRLARERIEERDSAAHNTVRAQRCPRVEARTALNYHGGSCAANLDLNIATREELEQPKMLSLRSDPTLSQLRQEQVIARVIEFIRM